MLTETDLLTGDVTYRAASDAIGTPFFDPLPGEVALFCDAAGQPRTIEVAVRPQPAQVRANIGPLLAAAGGTIPGDPLSTLPDGCDVTVRLRLDADRLAPIVGQPIRSSQEAIGAIQRAAALQGWRVADIEVEA